MENFSLVISLRYFIKYLFDSLHDEIENPISINLYSCTPVNFSYSIAFFKAMR